MNKKVHLCVYNVNSHFPVKLILTFPPQSPFFSE